ncbi:four helix bundle protein [Candidatus Falkowbacteria bacterium]|nr:four helix bundle protein [Candidatus Falkowbacteria bacterium]
MVHKICEFYKIIYLCSNRLPKRDRFGLFLKIEQICLEVISLSLTASLEKRYNKTPYLGKARMQIETLKRLIRISSELGIVDSKKYLGFELALQEMSKMSTNWLNSLNKEIP